MKRYVALSLCVGMTLTVFAASWQKHGMTVESTKKEIRNTITILKTSDGLTIQVTAADDVAAETVSRIAESAKKLNSLTGLTVSSLRYVVRKDGLEISLIPQKYVIDNQEVHRYLPGGLYFSYRTNLNYNFRLKKDGVFVRIKGTLLDGKTLASKILNAYKNPMEYIRRRDPEYILKKIDTIAERITKIRVAAQKTDKNLENTKNELTKTKKDLTGTQNDLRKTKQALADARRQQKGAERRLNTAILLLETRGLFGGFTPTPPKVINEIVSIYQSQPDMTVNEIMKELTKRKVKTNPHVVRMVLVIYFNKYK